METMEIRKQFSIGRAASVLLFAVLLLAGAAALFPSMVNAAEAAAADGLYSVGADGTLTKINDTCEIKAPADGAAEQSLNLAWYKSGAAVPINTSENKYTAVSSNTAVVQVGAPEGTVTGVSVVLKAHLNGTSVVYFRDSSGETPTEFSVKVTVSGYNLKPNEDRPFYPGTSSKGQKEQLELLDKYRITTADTNAAFYENFIETKLHAEDVEFTFRVKADTSKTDAELTAHIKSKILPYVKIYNSNMTAAAAYNSGLSLKTMTSGLGDLDVTVAADSGKLKMGEEYILKFEPGLVYNAENAEAPQSLDKQIQFHFYTKEQRHVTAVRLNKTSLVMKPGSEKVLIASIEPKNADVKDIVWTSSDAAVASVQDGAVTANKAGAAVITAKSADGNKTAVCQVTVEPVKIEELLLDKSEAQIDVNGELTLKAIVVPGSASNKELTWKSLEPEIASVDSTGKVKGIRAGTASITVTAKDGGKTAICKITVKPVPVETPEAIAKALSYDSAEVSWDAVENADGYTVFRKAPEESEYKQLTEIKDPEYLAWNDTGLITGKTYYYIVKAHRTVNGETYYSDYSDAVSAKPVLGKAVLSGAKSTGYNKAKLTWKQVPGAWGYEIYRAASKNGTYKRVKSVRYRSTVSAVDSAKLTAGTTYYYKVRAYRELENGKVYGSFSSVHYTKIRPTAPTLKVTAGKGKITAKWNAVSGRTGYNIYTKSTKYGDWKRVKTTKSTSHTLSVKKGKTCYVRVNAYRTVKGKKVYSLYSNERVIKAK